MSKVTQNFFYYTVLILLYYNSIHNSNFRIKIHILYNEKARFEISNYNYQTYNIRF